MSHIYGMEKVHMAVLNLVGPGSMQSRLSNAVNSHLLHISTETDLPKELRNEYTEIVSSISTGKVLSEIDAEHYAQKIVGLYGKAAHLTH